MEFTLLQSQWGGGLHEEQRRHMGQQISLNDNYCQMRKQISALKKCDSVGHALAAGIHT
ncbi:hypothetical protein [Pseudomonas syringae]|uniref:hypothetical protein n=1 Tax=Pseudomonas syringae TaxID=317 RepID=UPI0012AE64C7|nr:hypothetical protein [Pseudomonas syringae]MDG6385083.1 hypothetical protein [Pseudomonas syringae]MDU8488935.1 hypothetical protein [Pseudomonas syringae pv. actinidiae]